MKRTQILYFFALVLCPLFAVGQDTLSPLPKADNAIYGTLDNGLNYIIHPIPQQKTEYRLVLNVGSLQERDDEQGYAHFLEHMLFNGSDDFPGRQAIDTLQRLGYRFGRDINAYTTYERTVYELSLLDQSQQNLAITILANFLGKAHLNTEDIEKEKRIVIQEIKDFGTASVFNKKKLEGSQHAHRLPISSIENIKVLDAKRLKAFYKQWYSPSLATIIITGNVNPTEAIQQIETSFSSFKGNSTLMRSQSWDTFSPSFDNALEIVNTSDTRTNKVEIIRFNSAPFLSTKEGFKEHTIAQLYKQWLSKKLRQAKTHTSAHSTWYLPNKNEDVIEITAKTKEELSTRIHLVASVLNTMSLKGIHKEELEAYKQHLLNQSAISTEEDAYFLANNYIDQVVVNSHYLTDRHKIQLLEEILSTITANDLVVKHENTWSVDRQNLYLCTVNSNIFSIHSIQELNDSWNEGKTKTLLFKDKKEKKKQERTQGSFHWKTMPPIVKSNDNAVVKEHIYNHIGVTELTLANGLRIGIKPTHATDNNIILTVFTRNGLNLIQEQEQKYYQDASYFIDSAWIHGLTKDGYLQVGADREVSTLVSLSNEATIVNTSSRLGHIRDMFEWTYRKMYDYIEPKEDFNEYIQESIASLEHEPIPSTLLNNPSIQLSHQIEEYKKGTPFIQEELNTIADWQKVKLESFFELYQQTFANLDQVYILISGNFNVEDIKAESIAYFGSLVTTPHTSYLKENNKPKAQINDIKRVTIPSADVERTEATLVFNGSINPTLKESILAQMVRELFDNKFLQLSREKEGLVYSPSSSIDVAIYPTPKTSVSLYFSAALSDIEKLENLAKEVIQSIQTRPISTKDLDQMKLAVLNNKQLHLTEFSTYQWIEKLREVQLNFGSLKDFNDYENILNSITPKDVLNTANSIFDKTNYGVFLVTPK